jgi:hypothetical protein
MFHLLFAVIGQPLFGNLWLAMLLVLALVALLMLVVALAGRWLAATHPDAPRRTPPLAAAAAPEGISTETLAIIAGAVNVMVGPRAHITAVTLVPTPPPSVEALMLQWSLEGRREIYSSHKVR